MEIDFEKKDLDQDREEHITFSEEPGKSQTDKIIEEVRTRYEERKGTFYSEIFLNKDIAEHIPEQAIVPMELSQAVIKWEWFHSQRLLIILDYLKNIIENSEFIMDDKLREKSAMYFWKLRHYALSSDFRSNRCRVTYRCSPHFSDPTVGRVYAYTTSLHSKNCTKQIGLQTLPRWIRAAIASPFYWDVDIGNAHQSLLLGILDHLKIKNLQNFECAVRRRDALLNELANLTGCQDKDESRRLAKDFLTIIFYGGPIEWKYLKKVRIPISQNEDMALLDGSFKVKAFAKELNSIAVLLWDFADRYKDIFPSLNILKMHPRVASKPEDRRKYSVLSLFLQDEERKLLCHIEQFMVQQHRLVDCYIHDGGLVRKSALKTRDLRATRSPQQIKLGKFCPLDAFSIEEIPDYIWEDQFPEELLKDCQNYIKTLQPEIYGHITIVVKPFSEEWKSKIKVPLYSLVLDKTYDELRYYYETHHFLREIQTSSKFLYNGVFYSDKDLQIILPEKLYTTRIVQRHEEIINGDRKRPISPTRSSSGISNKSVKSEESGIDAKNYKSFWQKYAKDPNRNYIEKILFCREELDLAQMRKPEDNLINKQIAHKYIVLLEDRFSFDVLCETVDKTCHLHEVFLPQSKATDDSISREARSLINHFRFDRPLTNFEISQAYHFLNHFYLLCDKKSEEFEYVVKYTARMIQRPKIKEEGCGLILHSKEEGVGKSVAACMLLDLVSPFGKETHRAIDVFGQFGSMQENCLLLHLEDTDASEMKQFASHFKNRITAKTVTVEKKFQHPQQKMNLCRFLITTNDLEGLPIGENDRRFAVIPCSTCLKDKRLYFEKLNQIWSSADIRKSTFLVLEAINLEGFSCEKSRPNNALLKDLKSRTISIVKRFMIGVAFWLDRYQGKKERAEFENKYKKRVNVSNEAEYKDQLANALWINSKDLYEFFSLWCAGEPKLAKMKENYSQAAFSKEIRMSFYNTKAKNDNSGIASLPIFITEWLNEAERFGLNSNEDFISLHSIRVTNKLLDNLECKDRQKTIRKTNRRGTARTETELNSEGERFWFAEEDKKDSSMKTAEKHGDNENPQIKISWKRVCKDPPNKSFDNELSFGVPRSPLDDKIENPFYCGVFEEKEDRSIEKEQTE